MVNGKSWNSYLLSYETCYVSKIDEIYRKEYKMEMRRADRKLNDIDCKAIFANGEYGILSCCSGEKSGYGIPLNYVLWNKSIYFHCAMKGRKHS